ncbi:hypothetical protein [Gottfriedia luciferensis]|uniref:hypothetical protein n=1 Tax=Gottfriedia luciferensis TaxID=178774 RepID=UPI000B443768|nr:hypothetical protein [Gottfriedia luciferensis]
MEIEKRSVFKIFPPVYLNYVDIQEIYHIFIRQPFNTRDIVKDTESFGEERTLKILSQLIGAKCNFTMFQELKLFNIEGITTIFYYSLKESNILEKLKFLKRNGKLKFCLYVYKNENEYNKSEFEQSIKLAFIK